MVPVGFLRVLPMVIPYLSALKPEWMLQQVIRPAVGMATGGFMVSI